LPSAVDCSSRRWWVLAVAVRRVDRTFRESTPCPRGRQHSDCRPPPVGANAASLSRLGPSSQTGITCPQQPLPNPRPASTPRADPPPVPPRKPPPTPPKDSAPRWPPFASPSRGWASERPSPRSSARRQPERCLPTANCSQPDDANWTGAEIKSCCRLVSLLDVPLVQAAQNVVPVAVTAGDKIEGLRQWASGRCLSADRAGVYLRAEVRGGGRVRRVVRAE